MRRVLLLLIIIGFATSADCQARDGIRVRPMKSDKYGAIAGHMIAPGGISTLAIFRYGKPHAKPYTKSAFAHMDAHGNFIVENLGPGDYFIAYFRNGPGNSNFNRIGTNRESIKETLVTVKADKISYIGSFEVNNVKRGFFRGSFDFYRVDTPTEKEVLKSLLTEITMKGWDRLIRERLTEIDDVKTTASH